MLPSQPEPVPLGTTDPAVGLREGRAQGRRATTGFSANSTTSILGGRRGGAHRRGRQARPAEGRGGGVGRRGLEDSYGGSAHLLARPGLGWPSGLMQGLGKDGLTAVGRGSGAATETHPASAGCGRCLSPARSCCCQWGRGALRRQGPGSALPPSRKNPVPASTVPLPRRGRASLEVRLHPWGLRSHPGPGVQCESSQVRTRAPDAHPQAAERPRPRKGTSWDLPAF